jgi:hypothetical protein
MNSYGRYTVTYEPSDDPCEYLQVAVQMSISSEATLPDMVNFFTDFLRASGYVFDGELKLVNDEENASPVSGSYSDDYFFSNVGADTVSVAFAGGSGGDVISFG